MLGLGNFSFFLVFIVVVFFYLHITAHYHKGEDLELFETDFINNAKLQESCNVKQPLMAVGVPGISKLPSRGELLKGNETFDGNIRSLSLWKSPPKKPIAMEDLVETTRPHSLEMEKILRALETDREGVYISEGNERFLEEVGLWKVLQKWGDERCCPTYNVSKQYDFLMGSKGACTPLRYHTAYRKFVVARGGGVFGGDGNLVVRMTPWKSRKRMEWMRDDIGMETVSTMAAFGGRPDQREDWLRVRFLEFIVPEGQVLYIPPYWWYSIQFPGPTVFAYSFTYWSAMNWLANADIWARYIWAVHSASTGRDLVERKGQRKILSVLDDALDAAADELDVAGDRGGFGEEVIGVIDDSISSEAASSIVAIANSSECPLPAACSNNMRKEMEVEMEKEMEEKLRQKEDPVFQSLVIPT